MQPHIICETKINKTAIIVTCNYVTINLRRIQKVTDNIYDISQSCKKVTAKNVH